MSWPLDIKHLPVSKPIRPLYLSPLQGEVIAVLVRNGFHIDLAEGVVSTASSSQLNCILDKMSPRFGRINPVQKAVGMPNPQAPLAVAPMEKTRFRSFAARYVVERTRASLFDKNADRLEEGWKAILDAKRLYKQIHNIAEGLQPEDLP